LHGAQAAGDLLLETCDLGLLLLHQGLQLHLPRFRPELLDLRLLVCHGRLEPLELAGRRRAQRWLHLAPEVASCVAPRLSRLDRAARTAGP
tara:strand:+ start:1756 stop:2028 length:273 start_codon:yes stop_codon:yes gene_type:complete